MSAATVLAGDHSDHCFQTVQHSGTPVGTTINIGGMETYISEPKQPQQAKKILIFFSDVFTPLYINNKLIQDYFASHGWTVLGPDYFFGDDAIIKHVETPRADFDVMAWVGHHMENALAKTPAWVDAVKEKYGTTDTIYTAVGYCFGAPFVVNLSKSGLLAASAVAHPSRLTDEQFKEIKAPIFLSCAEVDRSFPTENRRRAVDILIERKIPYLVQLFSGVSHGFAVRGNMENENERWAKEESARGIIVWFERFANLAQQGKK